MLGLKIRLLSTGIGWTVMACVTISHALAQNNSENSTPRKVKLRIPSGLELGIGGGYVLPHRALMQHLVTDHSKRMTIAYGKHITGGWTERRKPRGTHWQGIELGWTDLGGESLGSIASAVWITRFPGSKWSNGELGIGVGWSSRPWDVVEAPSSVAISTRWNAGLHAAWSILLFEGERSAWTAKVRFTHFSNGALSLPNLGVNNIGVDLQHQWRENHHLPQQKLKDYQTKNRTPFAIEMSVRGGARDVGLPGGALHPIFNLHLLGHHKFKRSQSARWVLANDIGYNQSLRVSGRASGDGRPVDRLQYAALGGVRWDFNRIQITALQGWMITNPDLDLGSSHLMVTMHYECNSAVSVELGLKSFQFRADYPYLGIRHQFCSQRNRNNSK